jgi:hypothetical protein
MQITANQQIRLQYIQTNDLGIKPTLQAVIDASPKLITLKIDQKATL